MFMDGPEDTFNPCCIRSHFNRMCTADVCALRLRFLVHALVPHTLPIHLVCVSTHLNGAPVLSLPVRADVFVVVRVEPNQGPGVHYRISIANKPDLHVYKPYLPYPSVMQQTAYTREFLLTKCMFPEGAVPSGYLLSLVSLSLWAVRCCRLLLIVVHWIRCCLLIVD
jgi:hypothetical protein